MRAQIIAGVVLLSGFLFVANEGLSQNPGGKGQWGGKGQGKDGGDRTKFNGGGMNFNPLEWVSRDPGKSFDFMAKGKSFIVISEMSDRSKAVREALQEYAQTKGITNGQISREEFISFGQDVKARLDNGTLKAPEVTAGDPKKGAEAKPGEDPVEAMKRMADEDFKRRDKNNDGYLNTDEMPEPLKNDLAKWDKNNDKLIDLAEYRDYFITRVQGVAATPEKAPTGLRIVIDMEDLDKRPVVFRAGKLPPNLPKWFKEMDADKDGQIALWEWRKGGKDLDEFNEWDQNEDGFITAEEVLRKVELDRIAAKKNADPDEVASAEMPGQGKGGLGKGGFQWGGGQWGQGEFGKGAFGKGNFGKGGWKGGQDQGSGQWGGGRFNPGMDRSPGDQQSKDGFRKKKE